MVKEFRDGVRALLRAPVFTAAIITILAVGIGVNTATFSIVRAVLLRPLPYDRPDSLVYVWLEDREVAARQRGVLTGQFVVDWRAQNTVLSDVAAVRSWQSTLQGRMDLFDGGATERLRGAFATPNFFDLIGVAAAQGRTFRANDVDERVVVLSDGFWRRRFGADPAVIGRTITLMPNRDGGPRGFVVIGVLPPRFRFSYPQETEVWALLPWSDVKPVLSLEYHLVGRVAPSATLADVQAQLTAIAQTTGRAHGMREATVQRTLVVPETLAENMKSEARPSLLLISATAAVVMLIALVNLGLLVLARTLDRRRELAIRYSLGAAPWRLVRFLTMEGALLALVGGAAGVVTACVSQPLLARLVPPRFPRGDEVALDGPVLLFALAICGLTAVVLGVTPVFQVLRRDLQDTLRQSGTSATSAPAVTRLRQLIVTFQTAVVVVLLIAASLLIQSLWRLHQVDLGFEPDGLTAAEVRLQHPKFRQPGRIELFQSQLLERVRSLQGVTDASLTTAVPLRGVDFVWRVGADGGRPVAAHMRAVDAQYFALMRVPLLAGRFFGDQDTADSAPVAIVSESYARMLFGAVDPIGHFLDLKEPAEIVGVVRDVRHADVTKTAAPAFYLPRAQQPSELICVIVRSDRSVGDIATALRAAVRDVDPLQPVESIASLDSIVSDRSADRRFYTVTTAVFGGVALVLTVAGLFGVVSRAVSEGTRELAIRMSLGAAGWSVFRLVLWRGLLPVAAGAAVGAAGAFLSTPLLEHFLFETAPIDGASYVVVLLVIAIVALSACWHPARRASRLEPVRVLKIE